MELTKKAILRMVTPAPNGDVFFDIMLAVTEGEAILGSRTHGGSIPLGADADTHIKFVLEHFDRGLDLKNPDGSEHVITYPALSDADVATIRDAVAKQATPERMAKLAEKRKAEQAELEAEQERQKQAELAEKQRFADAVAAAVKEHLG